MKLGFLDHMGYGNLGDAATQDVLIAKIRKRLPDAQLVGFSMIPDDTTKKHGFPCYPICRWVPSLQQEGHTSDDGPNLKSKMKSLLERVAYLYVWASPPPVLFHKWYRKLNN
jgi:hypothetical protein